MEIKENIHCFFSGSTLMIEWINRGGGGQHGCTMYLVVINSLRTQPRSQDLLRPAPLCRHLLCSPFLFQSEWGVLALLFTSWLVRTHWLGLFCLNFLPAKWYLVNPPKDLWALVSHSNNYLPFVGHVFQILLFPVACFLSLLPLTKAFSVLTSVWFWICFIYLFLQDRPSPPPNWAAQSHRHLLFHTMCEC